MMKILTNIFLLSFVYSVQLFSGFAPDTLVFTPHGHRPISELCINDLVFGVTKQGQITPTLVTHVISKKSSKYFCVYIDGEKIIVTKGQKFFLPIDQQWRKAKRLTIGTQLLSIRKAS